MSSEDLSLRLTRAQLRQLQRLSTTRGRRELGVFLLDGEKLVRDAIAANAPVIELLSVSPEQWLGTGLRVIKLSQADSERLSDTRSPQGHFAVVRDELPGPTTSPPAPHGDRWQVVALDAIQDAGNVGGIIRSAAAMGVDSVIVGPGSADPTHARVTRAATGAWFHVSIARSGNLADDLARLQAEGARVIGADTRGQPLDEVEIPPKVVWLFGNEGAGISPTLAAQIDDRVAVPIAEGVESLNVNVAAGIILHHARLQARRRNVT